MDNKEFSRQMEIRMRKFGYRIIMLSASLPDTPESRVIRYQITKSGTSMGANYREANHGRSKADFINKIKICESEANETIYWLELIFDLKWSNPKNVQEIMSETNEILAIFSSISKKLKS